MISTCKGQFHSGYAGMKGIEEYGKGFLLAHLSPLMRDGSRDLEEKVTYRTVGEGEISKALRSMLLALKVVGSLTPLKLLLT